MCGISGIHNLHGGRREISLETLQKMILALHHRGPDEFGIYRDAHVGLASARLSIIDLAGGSQPISNEDQTIWIVFNGEIFNYIELRPQLEKKGHQFTTQTDTEVILHLYEEYGPRCLNMLNGQFAIALWDHRNRTLLLARDRLGIRPLFYTKFESQLLFASEIKSFFGVPGFQVAFDEQALEQVFTYWSPQTPRSIFHNVQQIPPAHYLLCREDHVEISPFWSLDYQRDEEYLAHPNETGSDDRILEEFSTLLIDATRIRLRADVPVGAYLSGGLDSSTTAAIIRKYTNTSLDSFSIAFSTSQFNESEFQLNMAKHLGTNHQVVHCKPEDIGEVFPEVIWHTETPILRTSPAPMYLLSKLVHQHHYKVVLTGEGADEMLAGYDIFKEMKIRRFVARHPESSLRPLLFQKLYPDIPRLAQSTGFLSAFFSKNIAEINSPFYSHQVRWANTSRSTRFLLTGQSKRSPFDDISLPAGFNRWTVLAQAQYLEIITFLSTYLLSSQGDRPAMAHSVEGRFPFLDYRVIEFCNKLPDDYKLRGLNEKYLLRKFAASLIPAEIWKRKKRPYRAPIHEAFFARREHAYVSDLVSEAKIISTGVFNPLAVRKLVEKARKEPQLTEIEEMALVGIISTQLVDHHFIKRQHVIRSTTSAPFKIIDFAQQTIQ